MKKSADKTKSHSVDMEVEYIWLKNELNSAIGTIKVEKTVSDELSDVLASMETQLSNLKDGKLIDLGELRGGDSALISQTIMAKKHRMTTAIARLQEELESVSRENKVLRDRQLATDKTVVELEEKYANCTVDLIDAKNTLQSEMLAHKVKCCNYEDEVAYHYKLLSTSSDAITKLCGNSNRYISFYKNVRERSASLLPIKGVSSLASVIAKSDFDLIAHKCQVLSFKALYKTLNGYYRTVMHIAMRKWLNATVSLRVREQVLKECSEHHKEHLMELSSSAQTVQEEREKELRQHYDDIINKLQAANHRLELSREQAVLQLHCNTGDNVLQSNITHNLNIRRSKEDFKHKYFKKWLSLTFKTYMSKYQQACTEIEDLKAQLHELKEKYLLLFNESASNSEGYNIERQRHARYVSIIAIARRRYFYWISSAFHVWSDGLQQLKHREQVESLNKEKAELLETCHVLSDELTTLINTHNVLVRHYHYAEVSNNSLSRQHQKLRDKYLAFEMLERWKFYHYRCVLLKYKCKSENYPNLRRLAQAAMRPPPPPPKPISIPVPTSPEVIVLSAPAPTPPAPSPTRARTPSPSTSVRTQSRNRALYVTTPIIVENNPDVVTYRYRK